MLSGRDKSRGHAGAGFGVGQDYPLERGLSPAHIPGMNGQLREYLINGAMILAVLLAVYGFALPNALGDPNHLAREHATFAGGPIKSDGEGRSHATKRNPREHRSRT